MDKHTVKVKKVKKHEKYQDGKMKKQDDEGKENIEIVIEKNKDGSIIIDGRKIKEPKKKKSKDKKHTLVGKTEEKGTMVGDIELDVEIIIDCSTEPPTVTIRGTYFGERFIEEIEITHDEQDDLLDWIYDNEIGWNKSDKKEKEREDADHEARKKEREKRKEEEKKKSEEKKPEEKKPEEKKPEEKKPEEKKKEPD